MAIINVAQESTLITRERDWVLAELARTDILTLLSDYAYKEEILEYRRKLKQYNNLGVRPTVATTLSGASL